MADAKTYTAALLIVGNEILSGRTTDANLPFIAGRLNALGIRLSEVRVVPDVEAEIVDAVNMLRARYTYVFTTGGIGPTHDDITADCVAKAFGLPLGEHPEARRRLAERYAESGIELNEARLRMARTPEGATLIGVEVDDESVAVASSTVEFAGLADRVSIRLGSSTDVIGTFRQPFDLVFLDHWKDLYKTDLHALEEGNLLLPGSVVFADNVGPHFNPEAYLDHVRTSGRYQSEYHSAHIEYRDDEDGVEISIFIG